MHCRRVAFVLQRLAQPPARRWAPATSAGAPRRLRRPICPAAKRAAAGRGGRRRAGSRIAASASQVLRVEERDDEVDEERDRDDAADQIEAAHRRAPSAAQPAIRPASNAAKTAIRKKYQMSCMVGSRVK